MRAEPASRPVSLATRKRAQEAILRALLDDDKSRRQLWSALLAAKTGGEAGLAAEQWAEPLLGHTGGWVGAWGWHYWRRRPTNPLPPTVSETLTADERRRGRPPRERGALAVHATWLVRFQAGESLSSILASAPHVSSEQAIWNAISRLASLSAITLRR
jgi:hypothetical protein